MRRTRLSALRNLIRTIGSGCIWPSNASARRRWRPTRRCGSNHVPTPPRQIFALDGDSIILDAKPELVVRLSNAITKPGTPVALGERWLGDDELWDFVPPAGAVGSPTRGFVTVSDSAGFVAALAAAGANTVIQLTPGAELDFQDLDCPFEIPAGVTVRGSRRGTLFGPQFWLKQGHLSTPTQTCEPGLFLVDQPRSRITGLRIRGPGRDPNGQMPPMKGVNVVAVSSPAPNRRIYLRAIVDHNDISDWGVSAVDLQGPDDDDVVCPLAPQTDLGFVRILRNYIHDNRENHFANAEGYGLAAGSGADPLVFAQRVPEERNVADLRRGGPQRLRSRPRICSCRETTASTPTCTARPTTRTTRITTGAFRGFRAMLSPTAFCARIPARGTRTFPCAGFRATG